MPDTTNTPQFVEDNAIVVPESKFNPLVEAGKKLISELIILSKATTEPTTEELKVITKGRNSLKTIRCDIENARVDLKKDIIKKERLIDSLAREYTKPIQELEEKLKEREKYKENMEAKRKQELARSRAELLLPYIDALRMVDYKLGEMAPEVFDGLLIGLKAKREAQLAEQARIEAERQAKAEADRIEQERIRAENEKLKQEAEEKRKQYEAELDKARIAREAQEEAARIEAQRIAEERRKEKEIADAKEKIGRAHV